MHNKLIIAYFLTIISFNLILGQAVDTINTHSELPAVNISATTTSTIQMVKAEFKKMPGSFQDPVRILMKYPGFSTANDGANGIIYKGLPPEAFVWQMEGVRIVNPNHLSNAGTLSDQPTYNRGGTLAIPASAIGSFSYDGTPSNIENCSYWAGTADLSIARKSKSYYDISLLGLEAGVNISKGDKNHFIAVRNSFVGLLSTLGTDFGGEKINFSDISLKSDLIKTEKTSVVLFANAGLSRNYKAPISLGDSLVQIRDTKDILYRAYHGIVGLSYNKRIKSGMISSTWATSVRHDDRKETTGEDYINQFQNPPDSANIDEVIPISNHTYFVRQVGKENQIKAGWKGSYQKIDFIGSQQSLWEFYPYFQFNHNPQYNQRWRLTYGTGFNVRRLRPDISLTALYQFSRFIKMNAKYALNHPSNFGLSSAAKSSVGQNAEMSISYTSSKLRINIGGFYHYWNNMQQQYFIGRPGNSFYNHLINGEINDRPSRLLVENSDAKTVGLTLSGEKNIVINEDKSLNIQSNVTIFNSQFQDINTGEFKSSRFNVGQITNIGMYYQSTTKKQRTFMVGINYHHRGGERYSSQLSNDGNYDQQFNSYKRIDVRISYYYPSRRGHSHRWSLDIQNVGNQLNDGYYYYDGLNGKYTISKQLGLIPVLSYRYEI